MEPLKSRLRFRDEVTKRIKLESETRVEYEIYLGIMEYLLVAFHCYFKLDGLRTAAADGRDRRRPDVPADAIAPREYAVMARTGAHEHLAVGSMSRLTVRLGSTIEIRMEKAVDVVSGGRPTFRLERQQCGDG